MGLQIGFQIIRQGQPVIALCLTPQLLAHIHRAAHFQSGGDPLLRRNGLAPRRLRGMARNGGSSAGCQSSCQLSHTDPVHASRALGKTALPIGRTPWALGNSALPIGRTPRAVGNSALPIGRTPRAIGKTALPIGRTPLRLRNSVRGLRRIALRLRNSARGLRKTALPPDVGADSESLTVQRVVQDQET